MKNHMKVTEITLSRGCTINMGDFQSERIDVSMTVQINNASVRASIDNLVILVEDELDTLARACTEKES